MSSDRHIILGRELALSDFCPLPARHAKRDGGKGGERRGDRQTDGGWEREEGEEAESEVPSLTPRRRGGEGGREVETDTQTEGKTGRERGALSHTPRPRAPLSGSAAYRQPRARYPTTLMRPLTLHEGPPRDEVGGGRG